MSASANQQQRPLVIKEIDNKPVSTEAANQTLQKLLNEEAGIQSAPVSTIQQLQQLAKILNQSPNQELEN